MSINLEEMSLPQLRDLRHQVDRAISSFEDRRKKEAMAELEAKAREMGFTLAELTGVGRKRRAGAVAVAKYANPADASQTWSGRGRRPQWVRDALDAGRDLSDLEV